MSWMTPGVAPNSFATAGSAGTKMCMASEPAAVIAASTAALGRAGAIAAAPSS